MIDWSAQSHFRKLGKDPQDALILATWSVHDKTSLDEQRILRPVGIPDHLIIRAIKTKKRSHRGQH